MAFTAKDVAALREKTGCGMMDCKKALTETDGNMEAAIDFLREKGLAAASKKAGRIAAEGLVAAYNDSKVGVLVEVNAETDFVAKNADFQAFVADVAATVAEQNPADLDALMAQTISGGSASVEETLRDKILTIGENMKVRRFARAEGAVSTYIHGGGRIGVMVQFAGADSVAGSDAFKEMAIDVAMHIAAFSPTYLAKEDVPAEILDKEKKILMEQVINEGKPENVAEKIVMGKIGKYYSENCLIEQAFAKDDKISVGKFVAGMAKEMGADFSIQSFVRYEKGEGLEKRVDNFADEVASMMK